MHRLDTTERFLEVLDGFPTVSRADERFSYNNAGYVVLALIAERASGVGYHELVRERVTEPAGLADTGFWRTDELPGDHAIAYLHAAGLRSNALHLPVLGTGDGGISSTAADLAAFWRALYGGRIVPAELVAEMTRPRSEWPEEDRRYGLGFHLHRTSEAVWLEGYDAGVSVCTTHDPASGITHSVIANWSDGAWPMLSVSTNTWAPRRARRARSDEPVTNVGFSPSRQGQEFEPTTLRMPNTSGYLDAETSSRGEPSLGRTR